MRQTQKVKNLCETALFIAIVFLGVFIIKFPGPFGYAHIGDSMIFLDVYKRQINTRVRESHS